MINCYIALGSNLNNPTEQVKTAIETIKSLKQVIFVEHSPLYQTKPMGPQDQADFVNAVAKIKTNLTPHELLQQLQIIENQHGRERDKKERFGPRTLDLDILLYGNKIIQTEDLTIPHYDMKERDFVLKPLYDVAPSLVLPCGTTVKELVLELTS